MVQSVQLQSSSRIQSQDAVVFAASSCSDEVQQRVSRLLEKFQVQQLVNQIEYCDITKVDAMDSVSDQSTLLVFLIDDEFLKGASASRAAYLATRKSVTGRALVVPLLTQADAAFTNSPLSFMAPVQAFGESLDTALQTFEQRVREFYKQPDSNVSVMGTETHAGANNAAGSLQLSDLRFDARLEGASQIAETVEPLPCHMSVYDDFIEHLIGRLQVMRMHDRRRNLNLFSEAVKTVLGAEMVYCYYRSKNGTLHIYEAESNQPVHECSASLVHSVLEDALKGYSHELSKCSLRLQNFLPQLSPDLGSDIECMVV